MASLQNQHESSEEGSIDVEMSCTSSPFEYGDDSDDSDLEFILDSEGRILPYQFEPMASESENGSENDDASQQNETADKVVKLADSW